MREAIVLPERRVALDDRGDPLRERRGQPRLKRVDVGRGLIRGGAHACKRIRFAHACGEKSAASHKLATSVGGTLTGRGGDLIVIDDPLKPDDAYSETKGNACNEWYKNTLLSRLDDKRTGAIIIVMQRIQMDDLAGFVTSQSDEWEVLNLPAIAELDEIIRYRTRKSIGAASARRFHRCGSHFRFSRR
jgi:hypothetical protein